MSFLISLWAVVRIDCLRIPLFVHGVRLVMGRAYGLYDRRVDVWILFCPIVPKNLSTSSGGGKGALAEKLYP